nr:universal stress protein [uncultured Desulfobulbus sp.]
MSNWKRIIIAINDSQPSLDAVAYVGGIAGHQEGMHLCLLHVFPKPPPDHFRTDGSSETYADKQIQDSKALFARAQEVLLRHGVPSQAISTRSVIATGQSISEAILDLQEKEAFGTIVVGKRGITRAEEFLFGSISNALIHNGRDIAVWVIG